MFCACKLEPDDLVLAIENALGATDQTDYTLLPCVACLIDQVSPTLLLVILLESYHLECLLCILNCSFPVKKRHHVVSSISYSRLVHGKRYYLAFRYSLLVNPISQVVCVAF